MAPSHLILSKLRARRRPAHAHALVHPTAFPAGLSALAARRGGATSSAARSGFIHRAHRQSTATAGRPGLWPAAGSGRTAPALRNTSDPPRAHEEAYALHARARLTARPVGSLLAPIYKAGAPRHSAPAPVHNSRAAAALAPATESLPALLSGGEKKPPPPPFFVGNHGCRPPLRQSQDEA